jgi:exonuclease SbcC
MIPIKLQLSNFMPYANAELNFAGIHVGCIAGDNGAGKSSLLDAITWVLWGRARSKRDDELIRQSAQEMSVTLVFDLSGNTYQVIRTRKGGKRGSGGLDFQILHDKAEWRTIAEPTIPKTQEKINHLLRLDYDTFINSAFLLQGRADEFTVKTPAQRKQVLADILGLALWERYEDRAKEFVRRIESDMHTLDLRVREIDAEIARRPQYEHEVAERQKDVIALGDRLREVETRYQKVQRAEQELRHLETQAIELSNRVRAAEQELTGVLSELEIARTKADTATLQTQLDEVHAGLQRLAQIETQRDALREQRNALAEESAALKGQNDQLKPQTEPLKQRISLLDAASEPVCPTCGQALTPEHRHKIIEDLYAEIENRRELYRGNTERIKEIERERKSIDQEVAQRDGELRQHGTLQRREAELQAELIAAGEARKSIARLEARRAQWQKTFDIDSQKHAESAARSAALRGELGDAVAVQAEYERVRGEEARARQILGAAEQKLAACDALVQVRESKIEERNRFAEEKGLYEELRLAFGKKGVPAMIIEAAIPEIEDEANVLLSRMTGSRMHVRFDTQKETQKGDLTETLDIRIADELGTRPYENYSGGEQTRVNFAVRVALSKLLARRAGAQLQTLVVDEGFGALDAMGRERLVEAIHAVQNDFERILVITHLDELKDVFPVRIDITKTEHGSQIAII